MTLQLTMKYQYMKLICYVKHLLNNLQVSSVTQFYSFIICTKITLYVVLYSNFTDS